MATASYLSLWRHTVALAMKLLHSLGNEAAGPGGVTQALFVNGALSES
jgi:hypothetical protein